MAATSKAQSITPSDIRILLSIGAGLATVGAPSVLRGTVPVVAQVGTMNRGELLGLIYFAICWFFSFACFVRICRDEAWTERHPMIGEGR